MLVKLFGVVDLIAGLILIFGSGIKIPNQILIIFGIFLLVKSSLGMLKDFASWIDFSTGIVFLLSIIIAIPSVITVIFGLFVLQKGLFSFL